MAGQKGGDCRRGKAVCAQGWWSDMKSQVSFYPPDSSIPVFVFTIDLL